jgi:large subunit ribosomal protein L35
MKQKLKSHRGAKKRFKVTGTGKVKAGKSHKRHILAPKPHKRKRQGRKGVILNKTEAKIIKTMLLEL